MYLTQIFWYLSWPLLILVCYVIIMQAIKKFEEKYNK